MRVLRLLELDLRVRPRPVRRNLRELEHQSRSLWGVRDQLHNQLLLPGWSLHLSALPDGLRWILRGLEFQPQLLRAVQHQVPGWKRLLVGSV